MFLGIDSNKLTRLVESFYKLTKIRMVIFDDCFNEIYCYPQEHTFFCDMMNKNPETHKKCTESAKISCQKCHECGEMVTYTCHAGLTEAVAPLREGNIIIGYIMFGQITNIKDKECFAEEARQRCESYPLDANEFNRRIRSVSYKSNDQIEAVSEIMNAFTSYIYLKKIIFMEKKEALANIISFIDDNLSSDLSIRTICEKNNISKTVLYDITKESMPGGIAKYIKIKRLNKAKELILHTDKSIEEISGLVGFLDSSYFRRNFKMYAGMSAKAYRKKKGV